ncbi:MAG: hypothetical protein QOG95_4080, partial [Mycobacterium sp.]|nr:hypothetical protein [Mycobacterium sp.]
GQALDHRAVDTAVHDAHRLQQLGRNVELGARPIRSDLGEHQTEFFIERCLEIPWYG